MSLDVDFTALDASLAAATTTTTKRRNPRSFYLDVVRKSGLDVAVADAITGGDLERSMDGASTLSITLTDSHRALLRNPDLAHAIDMFFAGYWWRLVKVNKSGNDLTLTFEDRDVAYLRRHDKFRKAKRNQVTRAVFVRQLVREVGQPTRATQKRVDKGDIYVGRKPIRFVCPELHVRQALADAGTTPSRRKASTRAANREGGINAKANLTVRGARASAEQRRNGERVLDVADSKGAGPKATLALMEAVIVESNVRNLSGGDADSVGILQLRTSLHGQAAASSIEKSCSLFLSQGFTGRGGAIALARAHPSWSAGQVAQGVQGSAFPSRYDEVASEAKAWVAAYGGASGSDTGGGARTGDANSRKKYEFRRGEPGKREDSWTCIQRLAQEVNWRAFMDRGALYFVSEDWLMRQKPRYVIDEDDDGVQVIDFDIDQGKVNGDVTVQVRAKAFQVPVGSVIEIQKCGIANGRYLVSRVRQSIFDHGAELTLKAPTPRLQEPVDMGGVTAGGPQGGSLGGFDLSDATGNTASLRDRIVAVAQASRASYNRNPNAWFYSQPGRLSYADPTRPPARGTRSDCSQWVAAVYRRAGAPAPGPSYSVSIATGNMRVRGHPVPLSQARPGDIIWWPSHVELYVGPGNRTIGHGSPPVDYGTTTVKGPGVCWRYAFLD